MRRYTKPTPGYPDDFYTVEDRGYETPCWVWLGIPVYSGSGRDTGGYGRIQRNGHRISAHRYFYEKFRGPIPEGLRLDHLCRVTVCVCPWHLEPVTHTVNIRRGNVAKLKPDQVAYIRTLDRSISHKEVGAMFGVSRGTIKRIRNGYGWVGDDQGTPELPPGRTIVVDRARFERLLAIARAGETFDLGLDEPGAMANIDFVAASDAFSVAVKSLQLGDLDPLP